MVFTKNAKGFTLVELLVVITIIGILATGAVSIYNSQIQKARDSTRLTDIKAIEGSVGQYYQDATKYPNSSNAADSAALKSAITTYLPKIPEDPKKGQTCAKGVNQNASFCEYRYNVGTNETGINSASYEISTAFENAGNITSKAAGDSAGDDSRLEIGNSSGTVLKTGTGGTSEVGGVVVIK